VVCLSVSYVSISELSVGLLCLFILLSVCSSFCLSVYQFGRSICLVCLFVRFICLSGFSVYLSGLSVCLICLFVKSIWCIRSVWSVYPLVFLSACLVALSGLSFFLSVSLACLSVCLFCLSVSRLSLSVCLFVCLSGLFGLFG